MFYPRDPSFSRRYNASDAGLSHHLQMLKETYPNTVALRMLRIIPAFSVGGVVNANLRSEWHARLDSS